MEKIYETFGIKRTLKNKDRPVKKIECDCCNKVSDINIYFTKKIKNKNRCKKERKDVFLCKKHFDELKKYINYFDI